MKGASVEIIKVGGSFLSSPESLGDVLSLAKSTQKAILVLSAFSGVTDRLQGIHSMGKASRISEFQSIVSWHANLLSKSPGFHSEFPPDTLADGLSSGTSQNGGLLEWIGNADHDEFLSIGEKLSALTISEYLKYHRIRCHRIFSDDLGVTVSEGKEGRTIDIEATSIKARSIIDSLLANNDVIVTTGFFGRGTDGRVKILGRNSSDYSAVGIAASLGHDRVTLLKDVRGIYRADPKHLPPGSHHIPVLSYMEALDICRSGSRVVHPSAVELAMKTGIQISVRRHGDSTSGTLICKNQGTASYLKG